MSRACPIVAPTRADELWRHTCFEAFIRPGSNPAYFEFNFAPSAQWAAYEFDGYRSGMRAAESAAPRIDTRIGPTRLSLQATLELRALPPGPWRLGLSAVIEEANGWLSSGRWRIRPVGQISPRRLLYLRNLTSVALMQFGIDRLIANSALRAPLARQARRALGASGVGDGRLDAFGSTTRRLRRHQGRCRRSVRSTGCAATSRTRY